MKKITKKIAALALGIAIMGGLLGVNIDTTVQATELPRASVSAIDPPTH